MAEALLNVAAMFLIMGASYVFMRISPYPVEVVNNLVFNFFLPVTVFHSITGLRELPAAELLVMAAVGFAVTYAVYLLCALATRAVGMEAVFRKTFLLGATYGNHVFLGVPVCYAFLGGRGTILALFFTMGGYFFLYGVGTWIMTGRVTPSAIFKNPLIVAMVAACLVVALHVPIPAFLGRTLSLIGTATFPLSMMVVGGGLKLRFFTDPGRMGYTAGAAVVKLAVVPLAAWGMGTLLGLTRDQLAICVLQAAMPTAVLVSVFSVQYDADPAFSNAIVALTTLVSLGTIPLLFFLLA
jgi:predicted permease